MSKGPVLILAMLYAPLTGVRTRDPLVLHAVDADEIARAWPGLGRGRRRLPVAACGVSGVRLRDGCGEAHMVPWPPRVRSLPPGYVRCVECQVATGSRRPRSEFVNRVEAS